MSWKPLLSAPLRLTLQKIAAAYGVGVDAVIDAALKRRPDSAPGAELAAKALSPATLAELRAIPRPEDPPGEVTPVLPSLAAHELLDLAPPAPVPPDVVITVDGVHLTCPCTMTHDELLARLAVEVPHLFAPDAPPVDLHRVVGNRCLRIDNGETRCTAPLDFRNGDVVLTYGVKAAPPAPPAEPPPAA